MDARQLGTYIARGRVGIGLSAMVAPRLTLAVAFGSGGDTVGGRAICRLSGARDAVIGAGGSIAVGQGAGGGDWLSMGALVDGFDGLVLLATPGLPKRARLIGIAALGAAVTQLLLSRQIAAAEQADAASTV